MSLFQKHDRISLGEAQAAPENFAIGPVRWREPCVKIIVVGNLVFALVTFAQIGLTAALKPTLKLPESNAVQITSQIKVPCSIGQRKFLYGFNFFTVIRNTDIAHGLICRDIGNRQWSWQFDEPRFSKFNSK